MKKVITSCLLIAIFVLVTPLISFSQTTGQSTLDIGGDDYFNVIKSDGSGGFYLAGSTGRSGNYDASFAHTSGVNTTAYSYGSAGTEFGTSLTTLGDGNVLITGRTNGFNGTSNQDVFLTKVNPSNGSVIWSKAIGTDSTDLGYKAANSRDGNILVVGPTGNNKTDIMLLKVASNDGHVIFSKKIGFQYSSEVPFDIVDLGPGNNIVILGYSGVNIFGANDISLTVLDSAANIQLVIFYGGAADEEGRMICTDYMNNGYVYIAGNTLSYGAGGQDFCVIKLFVGGGGFPTITWFKTYGGNNNESLTGIESNSKGLLLTGITNSFGTGGDGLLVQIDTAGTVLWSRNEGSAGNDVFQGILTDPITHLNLAVGYSDSYDGGSSNDGYMVITDSNGVSGTCFGNPNIVAQLHTINDSIQFGTTIFSSDNLAVHEVNTNITAFSLTPTHTIVCPSSVGITQNEAGSTSVYPNPFSANFILTTGLTSKYNIDVFDSNSRRVFKSQFSGSSTEIDLSGLPAGIYTLSLNNGNSVKRMKIVKY